MTIGRIFQRLRKAHKAEWLHTPAFVIKNGMLATNSEVGGILHAHQDVSIELLSSSKRFSQNLVAAVPDFCMYL
jgi:hypothetical protein